MIELDTIYNEDCLTGMQRIPDGSVDCIICDLPYGTTACKWDTVIPFEPLWEQYKRVTKPNAAIVLFGNEPFTSALIMSNLKGFKYRIDWDKIIPSGLGYAKYRPMSQVEDICVFTKDGERSTYNPQMIKRDVPIKAGGNGKQAGVYSGFKCRAEGSKYDKTYEYKNPTTLIRFDKIRRGAEHPTQKPVDLIAYLIRTYSNPGDTILDNTIGSGTTAVAALREKRHFIGFELNRDYYDIALRRIKLEQQQQTLF